MTSRGASDEDRAYFDRIARQNRLLEEDRVPGSLAEMFDRLDEMRRSLGDLASPGVAGDEEGDLVAHLTFLARKREILGGGADGA